MNTRTPLSPSSRVLAAFLAVCLGASRAAAYPSPDHLPAASTNIPPTVRITCPTPSPLDAFVALPSLRVVWEGHDPDGPGMGTPVEYQYILLGPSSEFPVSLALANPDSLRRYYAHHPLGPWSGWSSTGGVSPSATFTNLIPSEHYVFAVIAFDQAGDYSPIFTLSSNMLHFVVSFSTGYHGPVLTMTGPGLDYTYPTGGYCPCQSAEVPVDLPERRPATFHWSADAVTPCGHDGIRSYRWALDIDDVTDQTPRIDEQTDLGHWSAPSLATTSATLPPFTLAHPPTPEGHRLYIEAADDLGLRSLGIVLITVVPSTNGPPDCHAAVADPRMLWPRNHKLVHVNINGVSDPDGDPVTIVVTRVTQDEPVQDRDSDDHVTASEGDGGEADVDATAVEDIGHLGDDSGGEHGDDRRGCADAVIDPDGGLRLRAERDGRGNGRVYTVWFTAADGQGGTCDGSVQVCVPRDRRHPACVDDGRAFNSLGPCNGRRHDHGHDTMLEMTLESRAPGGTASILQYSLPVAGDVLVGVYDVTGRRVTTLVNEYQTAGVHQTSWNHEGASQGMYFVRLWTRSGIMTRQMLILK